MKFEMYEFSSEKDAEGYPGSWDVAIVGKGIDQRSQAAISYATTSSTRIISLTYDPDEMALDSDGEKYLCHQVPDLIKSLHAKRILIDATTLGVPEVGLLMKNLYPINKIRTTILYVEPGSYKTKKNGDISQRDFILSDEIKGYKGIPYLSQPLDIETKNSTVFFLGFEGHRLKIALEELNINPKNAFLVFGVPSYKPGWELNAFANNIKLINENDLGGRVMFCGADNPHAVLKELSELRLSKGVNHVINVVPIGSKPHSIGALIFCAIDQNSNLLYDHPIKAIGRSDSVGSFHLYKIN